MSFEWERTDTNAFESKDERLDKLYKKTLETISAQISAWPNTTNEKRIHNIEHTIERYYEKRKKITHYHSGPKHFANIKIKRLEKYNSLLYQQNQLLKERLDKKWWKFW